MLESWDGRILSLKAVGLKSPFVYVRENGTLDLLRDSLLQGRCCGRSGSGGFRWALLKVPFNIPTPRFQCLKTELKIPILFHFIFGAGAWRQGLTRASQAVLVQFLSLGQKYSTKQNKKQLKKKMVLFCLVVSQYTLPWLHVLGQDVLDAEE